MKFKELVDVEGSKHIIIDNGDGSYKSFPADNSNPQYIAFLEALESQELE
jgi:hypothetical protein